jgi:hypothetical protein
MELHHRALLCGAGQLSELSQTNRDTDRRDQSGQKQMINNI